MPVGLEVFSQYNETMISITDRITKVLYSGIVPVTGQTNIFTLTDQVFLYGTPFVHCHMGNSIVGSGVSELFTCMDVSHVVNGAVLTVTYGYTSNTAYAGSYKHPLFMVIGVY